MIDVVEQVERALKKGLSGPLEGHAPHVRSVASVFDPAGERIEVSLVLVPENPRRMTQVEEVEWLTTVPSRFDDDPEEDDWDEEDDE